MSEADPIKGKQFLRKLQAAGVQAIPERGKGGHYRLSYGDRKSVMSFHGAADLTPTYMKLICKQLGLDIGNVI